PLTRPQGGRSPVRPGGGWGVDGRPGRHRPVAGQPLRLVPLGGGGRGRAGTHHRAVSPGHPGEPLQQAGFAARAPGSTVLRRAGWMLGASALAWGLLAYPAYALGGERQLACSAVAWGLCLVPALLTTLWAEWTFQRAPEQYLLSILGGTGLRL